jgi:hypothetical protein
MGMETRRRSILILSSPGIAAVILGTMLIGGSLPNTTDKFSEDFGATGYVVVSVVRDGNEIYHFEDHNLITNAGRNFIAEELGGTGTTSEATFIGLSTNSKATAATDSCISTTDGGTTSAEITTGGLTRASGTYAHTADTDNWTISSTFTATGSHTGVQRAGLFTAAASGDTCSGGDDGTMVAGNSFSSVNLASGDQLTITWTIDLGL